VLTLFETYTDINFLARFCLRTAGHKTRSADESNPGPLDNLPHNIGYARSLARVIEGTHNARELLIKT